MRQPTDRGRVQAPTRYGSEAVALERTRLWERYRNDRSEANLEALIREYSYLIGIALRHIEPPPRITLDDLRSYALVGLGSAIQAYDPRKAHNTEDFSAYAIQRIRFSVIDQLRVESGESRHEMRLSKDIMATLRSEYTGDQSGAEPPQHARRGLVKVPPSQTVPLHEASLVSNIPAPTNNVDALIDRLWLESVGPLLRNAIASLPRQQRIVLDRHVIHGETLSEIGASLGVTESRACQIKTRAINGLRLQLRPHFEAVFP